MNNNSLLQFIQQGFRVTIGATASLVETIQDPQKRTEALSQLQIELEQKTREWAQKGEVTEQEARRIIDNLMNQRTQGKQPDVNNSSSSPNTTSPKNAVQSDLEELTEILRKEQD